MLADFHSVASRNHNSVWKTELDGFQRKAAQRVETMDGRNQNKIYHEEHERHEEFLLKTWPSGAGQRYCLGPILSFLHAFSRNPLFKVIPGFPLTTCGNDTVEYLKIFLRDLRVLRGYKSIA